MGGYKRGDSKLCRVRSNANRACANQEVGGWGLQEEVTDKTGEASIGASEGESHM